MHTILLVEDAPEFQIMVKRLLKNYHVVITDDPDQVLDFIKNTKIDLVLLDLTLPKRDGYSVLQELQSNAEAEDIPVICLTGKTEITDKVTAFSLGADDYIQKPFDPMEFKARVDAKLAKRVQKNERVQKLSIGDIIIDVSSHRVFGRLDNRDIVLTQTEYKILKYLGRRPGQVYTREQLLVAIWGDEGAVFDRAVDVHICSLRKKLSPYGLSFKSVSGVGYRIEVLRPSLATTSC